ncbi:hypothetical protein Q5P01_010165 [Channa striata]|uniref:Fork-head domain-containing protein n=1 Tax=Channa striata TaxID=64152 RepID=A0AA88SVC7_CHASR|nr:hypothetical protein Q5P01_010165 [Channa striata]
MCTGGTALMGPSAQGQNQHRDEALLIPTVSTRTADSSATERCWLQVVSSSAPLPSAACRRFAALTRVHTAPAVRHRHRPGTSTTAVFRVHTLNYQLCQWSPRVSYLKTIHPTTHHVLCNKSHLGCFANNDQSTSSKYPVQSLSTHSHQDSAAQSLFPKPIYSYSILIFMALKNSKTGSLPVSEIYSFMTEHFPYFKTAPDGWKNSVRHNLSLNKCFEKVENKNGNSSRKGCLWALNPAKVEKMQEELHKWRRKDPITVRRSMAKPEDLDRLLGERPDKLRSLPPYTNPALISRMAPIYSATSAQLRAPCLPTRRPQYAHVQPQQPTYLLSASAHSGNSFALYSPCTQQPAAGSPPATGCQRSPGAGKMPPVCGAALQAEYSVGPRSMQDFLLEGDGSYDIDALNPSLTDLQLQGNLWEEIREDSLVSDPQVTTTTPASTSSLQEPHIQTSCLEVISPVSHISEVTSVGRCKAGYESVDTHSEQNLDQHGCLNGLHPVVYSGVESLAAYLTSCTTSISLM